jgi:hypothetical protein
MKKLVVGLAAVPFLAGIAMAGQPVPLSDAQMDRVTLVPSRRLLLR